MNIFARVITLLILTGTTHGFCVNKPGHDYKLHDGENLTCVSPDKTLRVEQYAKVSKDKSLVWQFWVFDENTAMVAC